MPLRQSARVIVGHADAPRRTRGQLLACDEAVIEPAMNGARHDTEDSRRLPNRHQVARRRVGGRLEPRNIAIAAQAPDLIRR